MHQTVEIVTTYKTEEMKRRPMCVLMCAELCCSAFFLSLCLLHYKPRELPIFVFLLYKPLRYSSNVWLSEIFVHFPM